MGKIIKFMIDGTECMAEEGKYIIEAAKENGVYIPSLCNIEGLKPRGSCRICNVNVNGRLMTACTTPVSEGMVIENNSEEIRKIRESIIELLFVEGNHFCPVCERSGNCELQALGYRFRIMVPKFPYQFPEREIEANHPKLMKDHNRCILCKRCIRAIKDEEGRSIFAFSRRGFKTMIAIDTKLSSNMSDEQVKEAVDICPVGALIQKEIGFITPIGQRVYDKFPIGTEIESIRSVKEEI